MTETISLSALGRDVCVGDFYDYSTDEILPSDCIVGEKEHISTELTSLNTIRSFFYQQPDEFKPHILGINTHFQENVKKKRLNLNEFWFAKFLETPSTVNVAEVCVFIRVIRGKEKLDSKYRDFKLSATHLVEEVIYGADIVCSMRRPVDRINEKKESVEDGIYLASKICFENAIALPNSNNYGDSPQAELENVYCTILSSLGDDQPVDVSFPECIEWLRRVINTDEPINYWRPVEIILRPLRSSANTVGASEKMKDIAIEKERNDIMWNWIVKRSGRLSSSINQVLPLKRALNQFDNLLKPMEEELKTLISELEEKQNFEEIQEISELLHDMKYWLLNRHSEIETVGLLLQGIQHLKMLDLEKMKAKTLTNSEKCINLCVLTHNYIHDPLIVRLQKYVSHLLDPKLPVFPIVKQEKTIIEKVANKLKEFVDEADADQVYNLGLSLSSSSLRDGDILTIEEAIQTLKRKPSINRTETTEKSRQGRSTMASTKSASAESSNKQTPATRSSKLITKAASSVGLKNDEKPEMRVKVSQRFVRNSRLIKKGQPNIYLLNARQQNSAIKNFRSFHIGLDDRAAESYGITSCHKVIILMGASGCGKSTLIDGMVNYILGIKWTDSFRFKCVRYDDCKQSYSKTSSVTAYTIQHQEGMAVPYSITIIDTPGYGDDGDTDQYEENTQLILTFLRQQENKIEQIHAACFVATSIDSRLTVTQRYILDSVLSIFGKDFKKNIRLLVTFADNSDPSVVEACRAANFPMESAGITYSKFNNSVLYASNQQQGKFVDFNIDELNWDMGQENFAKFFKMLEGMDVKSTDARSLKHKKTHQPQVRPKTYKYKDVGSTEKFFVKAEPETFVTSLDSSFKSNLEEKISRIGPTVPDVLSFGNTTNRETDKEGVSATRKKRIGVKVMPEQ